MGLHPSVTTFSPQKPATALATRILQLFAAFRMVDLQWQPAPGQLGKRQIYSTTNLTILNAILVFRGVRPLAQVETKDKDKAVPDKLWDGPSANTTVHITEYALWWHVILFQVVCSAIAFGVRYWLASIVFPQP